MKKEEKISKAKSPDTAKKRKKAEETLHHSEERYRTVLENIEEGYYEVDIKGNFTFFNDSLSRILGYPQEEMMVLNNRQFTDKENAKKLFKTFNEVYKTGKTAKAFDWEIIRKDGTKRYIEVSVSLRINSSGQPIGFQGIARDITERKEIEYELRASESNFRNSLDDSPLGVRISTIVGETIYANRAILDIYGYDSIEELKKTHRKECYTPESYAESQLRKEKRLRGEFGPSEYEISIVRKNGEIRHLHVFRKEIFWNGKKQSQVICQDITLRRQAEEKLKEILKSLRKSIKTTIQVLGTASEARDPYTAGHQKGVADLARAIATEMGLPNDTIEGIRMAGSIHDIGKLSVPTEILSKPTKLTNIEFSLIKEHSQSGCEMLKDVESPWPLAQIVYQHHERMDGSGYPRNLKGDEIIMEARIMAVADVMEAMSSHRPYRPSLGIDAALVEIEKNKGTQYDNTVADACLRLFREKGYQLP